MRESPSGVIASDRSYVELDRHPLTYRGLRKTIPTRPVHRGDVKRPVSDCDSAPGTPRTRPTSRRYHLTWEVTYTPQHAACETPSPAGLRRRSRCRVAPRGERPPLRTSPPEHDTECPPAACTASMSLRALRRDGRRTSPPQNREHRVSQLVTRSDSAKPPRHSSLET